MPPILLYYLGGLAAALAIGSLGYYVVGFAATPLWESLFGSQAGPMWGRLFRLSLVMVALVGALSTKFYGCGGPTDYDAVARDHRLMAQHTSEQVGGSVDGMVQYLLLVSGVAALALALVSIGRYSSCRSTVCDPAATAWTSSVLSGLENDAAKRTGGCSRTVPSSERGTE